MRETGLGVCFRDLCVPDATFTMEFVIQCHTYTLRDSIDGKMGEHT